MRELFKKLQRTTEHHSYQFVLYGWLTFFGFGAFFLINPLIGVYEPVESLILRGICSSLALLLATHKYWPCYFKQNVLPIIWHATLVLNLPFFFTYMFLLSEGTIDWQLNLLMALVVLIILTDWKMSIVVATLGISLAWIAAFIRMDNFNIPSNYANIIVSYVTILIYCGAFIHKKEQTHAQKMKTAHALAGTIAHEANTPIASIQMSINELKTVIPKIRNAYNSTSGTDKDFTPLEELSLIPDELADDLHRIRYVVNELATNIKDINTIKGIKKHSLIELVTTAVNQYPFQKEEENFMFLEMEEDIQVRTDPILFTQALHNLIKNALYAIHAASTPGNITIKTFKEGDRFALTITDNGCGIPSQKIAHIFEVFTTTKSNGMGLGLAFVKKVVEAAGGEITCHSELGKYTQFKIMFNELL